MELLKGMKRLAGSILEVPVESVGTVAGVQRWRPELYYN